MPKFIRDALRQLAEPDTHTQTFEMTPDLKKKWSRIAGECVDLLKARTEGPLEAFAVLQFIMHGFEDAYGIRGGIIMENSDRQS